MKIILIYAEEARKQAEDWGRIFRLQGCKSLLILKRDSMLAKSLLSEVRDRLHVVEAPGQFLLLLAEDDLQPVEIHSNPTDNEMYQVALTAQGFV